MKKLIKAIYGNVALLKAFCPKCKKYSFVIDGKLTCCNIPIDKIPDVERVKREGLGKKHRRKPPKKIQKELLKKQKNKCIYCRKNLTSYCWNDKKSKFIKLKINWDHFVSWNYSRDNSKSNFVASCHICNEIKSDKYFPDIACAREYILEIRKRKGYEN